jgi:ABC-2 type transport system ATP-binding protein
MIEFKQLSKKFGKAEVLKELNLSINKGERIALVGSNGAGKTTLIRCLLGEYIYSGSVLIDGKKPRDFRTDVLKHVGFVPQISPPLKIPVAQLVSFVANLCESNEQQIIDMIEQLGLDFQKIKSLPFVKLSGGQKQKVLISIALGRDADILIMDEPAANLDPDARHIFFNILATKIENSIMLISSHRLDEVAPLVNRVIEMDQGKIVLDDKVEDDIDLNSLLQSEIVIRRDDPAFAKAIQHWGFSTTDGTKWTGEIPGPDRLRFLGVLSRYAALISSIHMDEKI